MNLKSIITKVGSSLVREVVPGGGLFLDAVNAFLPDDKQLGKNATGNDIQTAVGALPPEQRAQLLSREYDVEIAEIETHGRTQEAMAKADIARASTRPQVAIMMAKVVAFAIITMVSIWAVAVLRNNTETLMVLANSSALVLTILGTPTLLLRSYFGMRTKEKTAGQEAGPARNPLVEMIGAWRAK
ncbi:hypothetical protein [Desulfoluna spongiiphila]|uniref:Holin of 3TMs, for gene-transfer release n=1 Tax=Desulfoluna spongiiphila TaxID=419481 RepID=A0A1G5G0R8_9BACT|nr:hypothetical protein [Desulfoluna spongiiphila]SCY45192.1 hypothetical protein SAMN05216233_109135 [Desulfoluna spongiiphila]